MLSTVCSPIRSSKLPCFLAPLLFCVAMAACGSDDEDGTSPGGGAGSGTGGSSGSTGGTSGSTGGSSGHTGGTGGSAGSGSGGSSGSAGGTGGSIPSYEVTGSHYYVDADNGSDSNPGTSEEPFQTLPYALTQVTGGDGIYLRDGDYGDLSFGAESNAPIDEVFDDWVTIAADSGHSPVLGHVELGIWNRNGYKLPFSEVGNSDLRLRIDGVSINNQLGIHGSRYVDIRNCEITTDAEVTELTASGSCVDVMNGQHVSLYNNDIRHCGVGVAAMTTDFVMMGNEIHHVSHDGLKIYGGYHWVVEGNSIHDLDDGLTDDDPDPDDRNNHCDCIHMHTIIHQGGYSDERWAGGGGDVVLRGNLLYHAEAMGIMVNQNDWDGTWGDYTIENNLFGPSGGMLVILGSSFTGITVRHNTVLYTPNDVWTSIFGRTMAPAGLTDAAGQCYFFQIWGNGPEAQVYNNIFGGAGPSTSLSDRIEQDEGVVTNNLFIPDDMDHLPYTSIPGSIDDFLASGWRFGRARQWKRCPRRGVSGSHGPGRRLLPQPPQRRGSGHWGGGAAMRGRWFGSRRNLLLYQSKSRGRNRTTRCDRAVDELP